MAFNNLMISLAAEARVLLPAGGSVIEFGNQTMRAKGDMVTRARRFLTENDIAFQPQEIDDIERQYKARKLDRLTERYFKAIGFASYDAIDVNSLHGSLVMDLNTILKNQYKFDRTFDVTTNNGTGEHIFDQSSIFENAHNLTEKGGLMIHCLPANNDINHGFYSFSPLLFMDLAAINDYDILKITVGASSGEQTGFISDDMKAAFPLAGPALSLNDLLQRVSDRHLRQYLIGWLNNLIGRRPGKGPFILERAVRGISKSHPQSLVAAILRKRSDNKFSKPIQGRYSGGNIESGELRDNYTSKPQ
jgi:hypothetical protein